MNNKIVLQFFMMCVSIAFSAASAEKATPEQFRKQVIVELGNQKATGDSVGTPIRVANYADKTEYFLIVPVLQNGRVETVYRDDPRRNSVTIIAAHASAKTLKPELFTIDGARAAFAKAGVSTPDPKLVCVGPMSFLGSTNAVWFHDTGESFVLLSLTGRIVSEDEIAHFWPDHLEKLKNIGK